MLNKTIQSNSKQHCSTRYIDHFQVYIYLQTFSTLSDLHLKMFIYVSIFKLNLWVFYFIYYFVWKFYGWNTSVHFYMALHLFL